MARQKFFNIVNITDNGTDDIVLPLSSPNGGVYSTGGVITRPEPVKIPINIVTDESPENQPVIGQEIHYKHRGTVLNSDLNFLGTVIPERYLQSNFDLIARYNGSSWDVLTTVDSLSGNFNKIFTMANEASETTLAVSGFQVLKTVTVPSGTLVNKGDEIEIHITGQFANSGNPTDIRVTTTQNANVGNLYYTSGSSVKDGNFDIKIRLEKAESTDTMISDAVYLNKTSGVDIVHGSQFLESNTAFSISFEAEESGTPIGTEVTIEGFKVRKL